MILTEVGVDIDQEVDKLPLLWPGQIGSLNAHFDFKFLLKLANAFTRIKLIK